ncbi:MAG TPA: cupin domain-containing protein [Parapedobacter sp.]|uniref:cupin domain-containing protein n=1 Tax=Parapedobacter sp. TaxID=1958893 RepID=UPI002C0E6311|nr:cupin domain-containing protein [Parapedobacter sp.]HWK59462.1 cupin domain-containing protein [Parapedobacter sp.]
MEEKMNESTPQRPEGERTVDAPLVTIDLPRFMEQIKKEPAWLNGPRNAITVFKSERLRLVLIALHSGAELPTHAADGTISVQVLEGYIQFTTDNESVELGEGQVVTLHEKIPHSVLALEESLFLLTLAPAVKPV